MRRERAETDLLRFGFKQKDFQRPAKELSGGWRIRVALAMARHAQAQVLFLDEPTNHLDLPGILSLKALIESLEVRIHSSVRLRVYVFFFNQKGALGLGHPRKPPGYYRANLSR